MKKQPTNNPPRPQSPPALPELGSAAEEAALEQFGLWMDGQLEELVAKWAHLAAPNASRSRRGGLGSL